MLGGGAEEDYQRQIRDGERVRSERKADRETERERYKKSAENNIVNTTMLGFMSGAIIDVGLFFASDGGVFKKATPRLTIAGAVAGTALYAYRNFSGKTEDDKANANSTNRAKRKNE